MKSIHRLSCSKTVAPALLNYLLNMLHEIHHSYLRGKHNAGVMLFSFIAQYRLSIYQCRIKITVRELRINLRFYWPLICDIYNIKQYFLFFNSTEKATFSKVIFNRFQIFEELQLSFWWKLVVCEVLNCVVLRDQIGFYFRWCCSSDNKSIIFTTLLGV